MNELKIITLPHPNLRLPSRKVGVIDDQIMSLIKDMNKQSLDWENSREHEVTVALAAIQINQPWRVIVVREDFDDRKNHNFIPLINPEIVKYEGAVVDRFEGCLSVSDFYAKVPRHQKIRVRAIAIDGQEVRITAEGFLAEVLQHEIDHTKGITTVDRVVDRRHGFKRLMDNGELKLVDLQEVIDAGILLDE